MIQHDTLAAAARTYKRNDPAMPEEFRQLLIKLLTEHLENNGNVEYRKVLANIANAGLRFAPHGRAMEIEAEIVRQEVAHGQIVADLLAGLGADPNQNRPIKQYAFHIPLEDWLDLAWFHALIDRVGLYVGVEWVGSPYEPLATVSPQLEADEEFHTKAGFRHLQGNLCDARGQGGGAGAVEEVVAGSAGHVRPLDLRELAGLCQMGNQDAQQRGSAPEIHRRGGAGDQEAGLDVPDNLANRRFL